MARPLTGRRTPLDPPQPHPVALTDEKTQLNGPRPRLRRRAGTTTVRTHDPKTRFVIDFLFLGLHERHLRVSRGEAEPFDVRRAAADLRSLATSGIFAVTHFKERR
ncbi:hypothetical protein PV755_29405 [Streptomyces caniscabiei]|uniref:Uncharacterized protein n=1 Tax=Streptomyces caniscabiei TaxID=2746961 RepID=A0A927L7M8_9ACTN|nr:hypothetical protein [Streptomyces caniscabiei]MBD9727606.1 hypothetical protein [Streptomyces caniscabiei]MDX3512985.1 hypothetical protein [Streptomyces caniscabiei]MDX3722023.1 hypothetical protein [Streptomyces caniscabiei]WEO24972.1 hypothetical protein IHE65_18280 [Streptomyces caniscabiei]